MDSLLVHNHNASHTRSDTSDLDLLSDMLTFIFSNQPERHQ